MKIIVSILVGFLAALPSPNLMAATSGAVSQKTDWGLTGVTTPLEEYGLSLGDITVSRVFNPIGQLKHDDSIILARRLTHITNPWQELVPGTGLIVDGKKAVIRQIQPETPPTTKQTGLRVKLTVEEISGTIMTLEWEQELHNLNSAVPKPSRDQAVDLLKNKLRAGVHLIINGDRKVISSREISYSSTVSKNNKDLKFKADYYALSGSKGTLLGSPSASENITDAAWRIKDGLLDLAQDTAQLVTWKFRARDNDEDNIPPVTLLHRARGTVSSISLLEGNTAGAYVQSTHGSQTHTQQFKWKQLQDDKGNFSWQLTEHQDDFIEIFRVNDGNIEFKITPDSLLRANREASAFFRSRKQKTGALQLSSNILDADTVSDQIKNLEKIIKSDASETIKIDAKRQAVIYLARFYEHQATTLQAQRQERVFRANAKLELARKYERHEWLTKRKIELLKKNNASVKFSDTHGKPQPGDLNVTTLTISEALHQLKNYEATEIPVLKGSGLKVELSDLLRKNNSLKNEAARLREEAQGMSFGHSDTTKGNTDSTEFDQKISRNHNLALQFWSEYIFRTEGLKEGARKLGETGIDGNTPPPDPYLPEILLRQAWIYRQMGLTQRAISTYFDVLAGAAKQKVSNLTRFQRITLVARSQIANCYYEEAKDREDINEAIDLYSRLLRSDENELDGSQVELKLLRALFKSDTYARNEIRRLERNLTTLTDSITKQNPNSNSTSITRNLLANESKRVEGEIAVIEQDRAKNWTLLKKHAERFIENYRNTEPNLRYDGEIRYYKIAANKALGNALHVQRDMEILMNNESAPPELKQAWLTTRIRVMIDVANLLYSEAIDAEAIAQSLHSRNTTSQLALKPDQPALKRNRNGISHALPQNLELAINGYEHALEYDQTYRSQIMLRQQIGFSLERLGQKKEAKDIYKEISGLCEMHNDDLNPTLKVVKMYATLKVNNLEKELKQAKAGNESGGI
ncbi:MAG: hypothetical protein P8M70_09455 [Verrucomicrobiota bacterium]|nr:hypothetical protein [Verrucomicrobiota bacterium]